MGASGTLRRRHHREVRRRHERQEAKPRALRPVLVIRTPAHFFWENLFKHMSMRAHAQKLNDVYNKHQRALGRA